MRVPCSIQGFDGERPPQPLSILPGWVRDLTQRRHLPRLPAPSTCETVHEQAPKPSPGPSGLRLWQNAALTPTNPHEDPFSMAYVITEPCIGTKDNSCVEVCPVDCIHPTPDEPDYDKVEMLYIDPEECIDCDACVEACPVDAVFAEDQVPEEWQRFVQVNADWYATRQ